LAPQITVFEGRKLGFFILFLYIFYLFIYLFIYFSFFLSFPPPIGPPLHPVACPVALRGSFDSFAPLYLPTHTAWNNVKFVSVFNCNIISPCSEGTTFKTKYTDQ